MHRVKVQRSPRRGGPPSSPGAGLGGLRPGAGLGPRGPPHCFPPGGGGRGGLGADIPVVQGGGAEPFSPACCRFPPGPGVAGPRVEASLQTWTLRALSLGSGPPGWRLRDSPKTGSSWLKVGCCELRASGRAHPASARAAAGTPTATRPGGPPPGFVPEVMGCGDPGGGGEQELFLVLHPPCPCSFSVPSFFFFNSVELTFSPFHYSYWGDIGY